MRACLVVVGLSGLVFAADDAKTEQKKLEGTWQLVSAVKDGKATPEEAVKKVRVVIKDGKHSVLFDSKPAVKEIPFTIDPAKDPKQTVDTLPDGMEIKGIYKLEEGRLTMCYGAPKQDRPKEFAAKEGTGHTLAVWVREKKK